jgi:ribose transport system substrate-binding protein
MVAIILVASACSSGEDNTTGGSPSASGSGAASGVAEAQAALAAAQEPLEFVPPSEPFDVSAARGKDIWLISCCESVPILKQWRVTIQDALKPYGVSSTVFDGQGQISEWNRGMEQAIAAHPDAIVLITIPPEAIPAQIQAAKAAGVPVVAISSGKPRTPLMDGVAAEVTVDNEVVGRLQADWFIVDSDGKGNADIINVSDARAANWQIKGLKEEITALCPDCKFIIDDAPVTSWGTRLATLTTSAIQRDPNLTHLLPLYDAMTFNMLPGIEQVGASDRIRVGTYNATPALMKTLQAGNTPLLLDIGAPNDWFSYAIADATLRVLTDTPAVDDYHIGIRAFTTANVAGLDVSKENDAQWYGVDAAAEVPKICHAG